MEKKTPKTPLDSHGPLLPLRRTKVTSGHEQWRVHPLVRSRKDFFHQKKCVALFLKVILKMEVSDPKKTRSWQFLRVCALFWDGDLWSFKKVKWLYKWGIKRSLWITWVVQIGWKIPTWHLRKSKIRTESIDFLLLYSPIAKKSLSEVKEMFDTSEILVMLLTHNVVSNSTIGKLAGNYIFWAVLSLWGNEQQGRGWAPTRLYFSGDYII